MCFSGTTAARAAHPDAVAHEELFPGEEWDELQRPLHRHELREVPVTLK